jgi:hypothetical protein
VVAPGFLQNPEVRRWLNGIEPAWTMLEFNSLNALRHEPSASNHAIRLQPDLADEAISGSAVAANALLLLSTSSRDRWVEADCDRQLVPRRGRGDVRDYLSA